MQEATPSPQSQAFFNNSQQQPFSHAMPSFSQPPPPFFNGGHPPAFPPPIFSAPPPGPFGPPPTWHQQRGQFYDSRQRGGRRPRENPEIPKNKLTDFTPSSVRRVFSRNRRFQVAHPRTTYRRGGRGGGSSSRSSGSQVFQAESHPSARDNDSAIGSDPGRIVVAATPNDASGEGPRSPPVNTNAVTQLMATTPTIPAGGVRRERKSRVAALKPAQAKTE